jgi:peroxiredoxin
MQRNSTARILRVSGRAAAVTSVMTQLALLALVQGAYAAESRGAGTMPEFSLKTLDGETYDSGAAFADKPGVVAFWRPDQLNSEKLLVAIQKLQTAMAKDDIEIVTICAGDVERGKIRETVERLKIEVPVLLDPDRAVYGEFKVIVCPSVWFVDKSGEFKFYVPGYRRDFEHTAKADMEVLLGRITEADRNENVKEGEAVAVAESNKGLRHYKMGLQLRERGRQELALNAFEQAWRSDPPMAEAGVELGLMLLNEDKNSEALDILTEVTATVPDDLRAAGAKAVALIRTGQAAEGEKMLKRVLDQKPAEPFFYYEMGVYFQEKGLAEESLGYFREGLETVLRRK